MAFLRMESDMKLSKYNLTEDVEDGLVVFNTASGGILKLNERYGNQYRKMEKNDWRVEEGLVSQLKYGGMLIEDEVDEKAKLDVISHAARYSSNTLHLTIAPTLACNFRCPYCYEKGRRQSGMNAEVEEDLIEFIRERAVGLSELSVCWYGGEPLLRIGQIRRLTGRIKEVISEQCSYHATIVTNGYLLSDEVASELVDLDVRSAQVTLDGSRAEHDRRRIPREGVPTFDVILNNIEKCCQNLQITIRANVDKTNISSADELLDEIERRSLKGSVSFYLAPVDNVNGTCLSDSSCFSMKSYSKEEVVFYRKAIERGFSVSLFNRGNPSICGAVSKNAYVVDPMGALYKCWDEVGDGSKAVGSVKEGPMLNNAMIRWLSYEPDDEECSTCFAYPVCMGGCPHHTLNGDGKRCSSLRYNVDQRLSLLDRACIQAKGAAND